MNFFYIFFFYGGFQEWLLESSSAHKLQKDALLQDDALNLPVLSSLDITH